MTVLKLLKIKSISGTLNPKTFYEISSEKILVSVSNTWIFCQWGNVQMSEKNKMFLKELKLYLKISCFIVRAKKLPPLSSISREGGSPSYPVGVTPPDLSQPWKASVWCWSLPWPPPWPGTGPPGRGRAGRTPPGPGTGRCRGREGRTRTLLSRYKT